MCVIEKQVVPDVQSHMMTHDFNLEIIGDLLNSQYQGLAELLYIVEGRISSGFENRMIGQEK
jgi:hypothetical protein